MRTHVYVDGFNFYYGCVKGTPFKWLDFQQLFRRLLPPNDVRAIKYFTARVEARIGDPDQATRQDTYLRALQTLPGCEIVLGQFLTHRVTLPRADGLATRRCSEPRKRAPTSTSQRTCCMTPIVV